jgi:hypothetical protein
MNESPQELERKAAKYRQMAQQVADKQTADRILALAKELEQQARQQQ